MEAHIIIYIRKIRGGIDLKKYIRISSWIVDFIFFIFLCVRIHYPKSYPPLDKYFFILIGIYIGMNLLVSKYKLLEPREEHFIGYTLKGLVFIVPMLYSLFIL